VREIAGLDRAVDGLAGDAELAGRLGDAEGTLVVGCAQNPPIVSDRVDGSRDGRVLASGLNQSLKRGSSSFDPADGNGGRRTGGSGAPIPVRVGGTPAVCWWAMEVLLGGVVAAGVGALVTWWTQRRQLEHQTREQERQLEHETREALRRTYAELLVAQRRSREGSLRLAEASGGPGREELARNAIAARHEFIDRYHELNLDSTREIWLEARGLRDVLGDMLKAANEGDNEECQRLGKVARKARQNLERSLRIRLGHEVHQRRRNLGEYDKVEVEPNKPGGERSGPL
jgi:hypothetical protein